jgi:hypothetical protein
LALNPNQLEEIEMEYLKPNTNYKIVSIRLACPESIDDGELTDGLNEMLRNAMSFGDCVFDDYAIDNFSIEGVFTGNIKTTDSNPEEGELFNPINCSECHKSLTICKQSDCPTS